tara:strand:+ start:172 stop:1206 length:1035 start_codon:yes stop_codon:yes gene_type:complete
MSSYSRLNPEDLVVSTDKVTTDAWSNTADTDILTTAITSSVQAVYTNATSQGNFFIEVRPGEDTVSSSVQYTISYGHKAGSGSKNFTDTAGALGNTATKVVYSQYRQLVYGDESSNFTFNGFEPNDIWVVNVSRERYKHGIKEGSLNLKLVTGGTTLHLTDDSITSTGSATITNLGRQFNLVSGSSGVMSGSSLDQTNGTNAGSGSFGFVYPEAGVIVFNGECLRNVHANYTEGSAASSEGIPSKLHAAIAGGASFQLDAVEKVSSQYMFVRVKNSEYNYSSNPSYIDTNGNLNNTTMQDSPATYITTVGLYNDDNNLLAVAKLSQPLKKDFTKEALIRVKLDY